MANIDIIGFDRNNQFIYSLDSDGNCHKHKIKNTINYELHTCLWNDNWKNMVALYNWKIWWAIFPASQGWSIAIIISLFFYFISQNSEKRSAPFFWWITNRENGETPDKTRVVGRYACCVFLLEFQDTLCSFEETLVMLDWLVQVARGQIVRKLS